VVTLHVTLAVVAAIASLVVIAAAIWSAIAGRRSDGHRDHRSAVDRAVLFVLGSVLAAGLIGAVMVAAGSRPGDPLHFLYGPAALIALPVAISVGARKTRTGSSRFRRDVWTAGGGLVLLGIALRLFATG
jgi:heme A synthase